MGVEESLRWPLLRCCKNHLAVACPHADLLHDPNGDVLVWRREGEEWELEDGAEGGEDEDEGFTVHDLEAIGREAEERLGCSVEAAAMQVRWPRA